MTQFPYALIAFVPFVGCSSSPAVPSISPASGDLIAQTCQVVASCIGESAQTCEQVSNSARKKLPEKCLPSYDDVVRCIRDQGVCSNRVYDARACATLQATARSCSGGAPADPSSPPTQAPSSSDASVDPPADPPEGDGE